MNTLATFLGFYLCSALPHLRCGGADLILDRTCKALELPSELGRAAVGGFFLARAGEHFVEKTARLLKLHSQLFRRALKVIPACAGRARIGWVGEMR
jgi:hypothetical protein